jgi:hypothetical protein
LLSWCSEYATGWMTEELRFVARAEHPSVSWAHRAFYSRGIGVSFPAVKKPQLEPAY